MNNLKDIESGHINYCTRQRFTGITVGILYFVTALLFLISAIWSYQVNTTNNMIQLLRIYIACAVSFLLGASVYLIDIIIP